MADVVDPSAAHATTRREPCDNAAPRSRRRPERGVHRCDRARRHGQALCRCACGAEFRPGGHPELVTVDDWLAEAAFWLQVADDRIRESDAPRWSSRPENQRTDAERVALVHDSLGAHASAMAALRHARKMAASERTAARTVEEVLAAQSFGLHREEWRTEHHNGAHDVVRVDAVRAAIAVAATGPVIGQADVRSAFRRGQADTLARLAEAADRRVAPHPYDGGGGHLTHPDDLIKCCPFGPDHPVHRVRLALPAP